MKLGLVDWGIPLLFAVVAAAALCLWIASYFHPMAIAERPLGADLNRPALPSPVSTAPEKLLTSGAAVAPVAGEWPCFRGPNRDGVDPDPTPLARSWGSGPKVLWSVSLGEGYASAAVHAGRVYVLDYDQGTKADALRCFALADGREVWRRSYPVLVKRNHGMSRTVPAVTDKYVVTLGPKCHLMCCNPLTGELLWRHDLVPEFGATVPDWYNGQCPLIDGDKVIIATGGPALLVAFDLVTGKPLWRSPNPRKWDMTHSSVLATDVGGKRMYVYCGSGGVAGVSGDGKLLWDDTEWVVNTATVPTPVSVGGGRLFLSGGYNAGAMMIEVTPAGMRKLFRLPASVFGSDQQTPIFYRGYIYGVAPEGELVCLSLDGKRVWSSGHMHRFGLGPYTIAGGMIYAMNDSGRLSLAVASPSGYRQLAETQVLSGPDAWGPIAVAGTRLLARDLTRMVCLDVGGKP